MLIFWHQGSIWTCHNIHKSLDVCANMFVMEQSCRAHRNISSLELAVNALKATAAAAAAAAAAATATETDIAGHGVALSDQPTENRLLLQQTLLEIHRFISKQNLHLRGELFSEEEIASDESVSDKHNNDNVVVDSQTKQSTSNGNKEPQAEPPQEPSHEPLENLDSRDGKQPKLKHRGSVFSKLGSYRQKKTSSVSSGRDSVKQNKPNSTSAGEGPAVMKTTTQGKRAVSAQADQNLNSGPLHTATTGSPKTSAINTGYFQWRRVAAKLGVDRAISEDHSKDVNRDPVEELHSARNLFIDLQSVNEINSSSVESLDDVQSDLVDVDDELSLFTMEHQPEAWSVTVDKKTLKKMTAKNIKRQDHIWEFVQTEKSHCQTLRIIQKIFAFGMLRELNMSQDMVNRIFPCLDDLLDIHLTFLNQLLSAQRRSSDQSISEIGQILQEQFEGPRAEKMKSAYGTFCSLQTESIQLYKDLLKSDVTFQAFIKKCGRSNLSKRLGIPECILLVTQRITKYPLLIEPIIRTTPETSPERKCLVQSLATVRAVITHVEQQIEAREKELRLFEIYNRLDARSTAVLNGRKFKKSDLLSKKKKVPTATLR